MPPYGYQAETFRVVASNGGTLNFITSTLTERDSDPLAVRVEKRRQEAELKRQQWYYNYFNCLGIDETLRVVPCDGLGFPIRLPAPLPPEVRMPRPGARDEEQDI